MKTDIQQQLESVTTIALFGHKHPDGDCIGALLGLGRLLEKMGKTVSYIIPTPASHIYDFLPNISKLSTGFDYGKYDLLVFLDFSDFSRIDDIYYKNPSYFENQKTIVIDHHKYNGIHPNRIIISDPTAMSACEIIFEYTYQWWPKIYDAQIATYFYLGLTTDSGNFRYDEDHKRILSNALQLVELGADKKLVVNNAFRKKSFSAIKMMQRLFKRLQKDGDLVYSWYTQKDLQELKIDSEEANFGQVILQDIEDTKVFILFKEDKKNKKISISLRSKEVDVEKIAKKFGGGGHIHAAGCTVLRDSSFAHQRKYLIEEIKKIIS